MSDMRKIAKAKNGKCLSIKYKNMNSKLMWQCKFGHIWYSKASNVKYGTWCPYCVGRNKTIKDMQIVAKQRNGKCLSKKYINPTTKLTWQCSEGHKWKANPNSILNGRWCSRCAKNLKKTLKEIRQYAKKHGGKCLATKYINTDSKVKWQCKNGHIWETTPAIVKRGAWCSVCAKNKKGSIQEMCKLAKKRKGRCLSTEYINSQTKLKWECAKKHTWWGNPANIKKGTWCPACGGTLKRTLKDMQQLAIKMGGWCISKKYINMQHRLKWKCNKHHTWYALPSNVKRGVWCQECKKKFLAGNKVTRRKPIRKLIY